MAVIERVRDRAWVLAIPDGWDVVLAFAKGKVQDVAFVINQSVPSRATDARKEQSWDLEWEPMQEVAAGTEHVDIVCKVEVLAGCMNIYQGFHFIVAQWAFQALDKFQHFGFQTQMR